MEMNDTKRTKADQDGAQYDSTNLFLDLKLISNATAMFMLFLIDR